MYDRPTVWLTLVVPGMCRTSASHMCFFSYLPENLVCCIYPKTLYVGIHLWAEKNSMYNMNFIHAIKLSSGIHNLK